MSNAIELKRSYGALGWRAESVYRIRRMHTMPATIESRSGTVLFKATANADPDDARRIVAIVNTAIEGANQ